jgi:hypothetical protein
VDVDPRFRDQFEQMLARNDLADLDGLMHYHGYYDELPLFARYSEVSFLDHISPEQRNRVVVRAAVAHLKTILDHSQTFYAGREYDYFCAITVENWDWFHEDGSPVVPKFFYGNPSHGLFDYLELRAPTSDESRFVAESLDHSPAYVINDDIDTIRWGKDHRRWGVVVARVWIQHVSCLVPPPP